MYYSEDRISCPICGVEEVVGFSNHEDTTYECNNCGVMITASGMGGFGSRNTRYSLLDKDTLKQQIKVVSHVENGVVKVAVDTEFIDKLAERLNKFEKYVRSKK